MIFLQNHLRQLSGNNHNFYFIREKAIERSPFLFLYPFIPTNLQISSTKTIIERINLFIDTFWLSAENNCWVP